MGGADGAAAANADGLLAGSLRPAPGGALRDRMRAMVRAALGVAAVAFTALVQAPVARLTAEDYARAEQFLPARANPLVRNMMGAPTWLPDGRVWYRTMRPNGTPEFVLVNPATRTRTVAPDLAKLGIEKATPAA